MYIVGTEASEERRFIQSPLQREFCDIARKKQIALFLGGLQSGKSVSGADALYELLYDECISLPDHISGEMSPEVWIMSRSYVLAQTAFDYFKWRASEDVFYSDKEAQKLGLIRGDSTTYWLRPLNRPDGKPIRLRVRTAADPEALRATANLLVAWADETAHWKEMAWQNLQGRMIASRGRILLTTTPKGKNWLYHDVYVPAQAGEPWVGVVRCKSIDSPWSDKEYLDRLRRNYGQQYASQELDAEFTAFEGQVYTWDEDEVLVDDLPPLTAYDKICVGVDPGFADPYAILFCGTRNKIWTVFDEIYVTRHTTQDLLPLISDKLLGLDADRFWVDPRRPTEVSDLRRVGYPATAAREIYAEKQRRFTIMPGIRLVQWLFNEKRLKISRRHCPNLIEELHKYTYRESEDRNRGEQPVDIHNHACDSLRYLSVSEEGHNFTSLFPMYREGDRGAPKADRPRTQPIRVPSLQESLAFQDEVWEKEKERVMERARPPARVAGKRRFRVTRKRD